MSNNNTEVAEKYLRSLNDHDLSQAPLADDIKFDNPISGPGVGKDAFAAFITGFLASISEIKVVRHIAEGNFVATQWDVDSTFGEISVMEMYRIENGVITEMKSYFDPRPVFG